jgi:hypothetical protein
MRKGQRVFWHGVFPSPAFQGTVHSNGLNTDLRQEILWDRSTKPRFEYTRVLMPVSRFGTCCDYCAALKARRS